jgi:hypothetical protein
MTNAKLTRVPVIKKNIKVTVAPKWIVLVEPKKTMTFV